MAGAPENDGPGGEGRPDPASSPEVNPQVETPVSPPAGEPPPSPPPAEPEKPKEEAQPRATDWRDRRIGEQQARIRELRARIEQYERSNTSGTPAQGQNGYTGAPPDPLEIERQVQERATAMAAINDFNRRCDEVASAGRTAYPDFDGRVQKLVGLVDGNDPQAVATYNSFLSAAMETGDAARLIHDLGGDLDEASRILSLSPVRMAVELTKRAVQGQERRSGPAPVSGAPRPINPAASAGQGQRHVVAADSPDSDQMPTSEWMRRREEQLAARRTGR